MSYFPTISTRKIISALGLEGLRRDYTHGSITLYKEIDERIRACARRTDIEDTNCIGTALYITGEVGEERIMSTLDIHLTHLSKLKRLEAPIKGCLVAWHVKLNVAFIDSQSMIGLLDKLDLSEFEQLRRDKPFILDTVHLGVVTSLRPIRITHRKGEKGMFFINQRKRDADEYVYRITDRMNANERGRVIGEAFPSIQPYTQPEIAYYLPSALHNTSS